MRPSTQLSILFLGLSACISSTMAQPTDGPPSPPPGGLNALTNASTKATPSTLGGSGSGSGQTPDLSSLSSKTPGDGSSPSSKSPSSLPSTTGKHPAVGSGDSGCTCPPAQPQQPPPETPKITSPSGGYPPADDKPPTSGASGILSHVRESARLNCLVLTIGVGLMTLYT